MGNHCVNSTCDFCKAEYCIRCSDHFCDQMKLFRAYTISTSHKLRENEIHRLLGDLKRIESILFSILQNSNNDRT